MTHHADAGPRSGSAVVKLKVAHHASKPIEQEDWYHTGGQQSSVDMLRDMPVGSFFLRKSSNLAFLFSVDIKLPEDTWGNFVGTKRIKKLPGTLRPYTYEGEEYSLTTMSVRDLLAQ